MKYKKQALITHESLSKLLKEKPDVFSSVAKAMIDKVINDASNPETLLTIQQSVRDVFKTEEEKVFESSLDELKNMFKRG